MKYNISIYDGTMTNDDLDVDLATTESHGLMSKEDKAKLDSIVSGGSGSIESITGSMVTQDSTHRFVTDTEKSTWNAKADKTQASASQSGLMSKEDKAKLDGIANNANNYVHPSSHAASIITQDSTHRFVTDTEKSTWNAKASTAVVTTSANGLMSKEDKTKLDGITEGATKYTHPDSHPATMVTQDSTHRFVTDAQINNWDAKPDDKTDIGLGNVTNDAQVKRSEMGTANGVATLDGDGKVPTSQLPSYVDDVVEVENYEELPETGETGKIYVDISTNKTYRWAGSVYVGISPSIALGETSSTAYAGDKGKANADEIAKIKNGTTIVPKAQDAATVAGFNIEANVPSNAKFTDTVYSHPSTHAATMITEDSTHRFVTDTEKSTWNAKADTTKAEAGSKDGLMSKEDKTKLDGIEANANNYTHPEKHDANMITESSEKKFVSDAQISTWNSKADTTVASTEFNGLMAKEDKTKLDNIEESANNYTHPVNHAATMITEDTTHRFVTDTEKSTWNAKADKTEASSDLAGLMSAVDKAKLDGLIGVPVNFTIEKETNPSNPNIINIKYGEGKELKMQMYLPEEQFDGKSCFITDELASFYSDLGGHPESYNMNEWDEESDSVEDLTAENGPYLVLSAMNIKTNPELSINTFQYVTSLKSLFDGYVKKTDKATNELDGLMSKEDKKKLDSIDINKIPNTATLKTETKTIEFTNSNSPESVLFSVDLSPLFSE